MFTTVHKVVVFERGKFVEIAPNTVRDFEPSVASELLALGAIKKIETAASVDAPVVEEDKPRRGRPRKDATDDGLE